MATGMATGEGNFGSMNTFDHCLFRLLIAERHEDFSDLFMEIFCKVD